MAEIDDKCVYEECVHDETLKQQVRAALESDECDYCGNTAEELIAAPVRVAQDHSSDRLANTIRE